MAGIESKQHYLILDGLRGVAALMVVAYHLFEGLGRGALEQSVNHGYLAVDFFYVLSGFVIGYAYDDRWNRMSTWTFFKRRLVRLHPLVIFGTLFGAALFYLQACGTFPLIAGTPPWKLALLTLLGCTMLPALTSWDIRGWCETNPLDGPTWSLMWEYLANILYATVIRRLSKVALAVFVAFAALLTLNLALDINVFGLIDPSRAKEFHACTVIGGWAITKSEAAIGLTRLLYPFFAGLLLARLGKLVRVRCGFWVCSALVAFLLAMPRLGGAGHVWMNGAYEAFCILVMFPLIVAMGAGSGISNPRSVAVCKFFGDISYPIYVTHFPLVYLWYAWLAAYPAATAGVRGCVAGSIYLLAIGVAYAALKLYDLPVRAWLRERVLAK